MICPNLLVCPICHAPLRTEPGKLECTVGHSFDVAKEGYVNLLMGKSHGDTKAMVQARRAFLDAGHFAALSDQLNALAAHALQVGGMPHGAVVDIGSGEGYYLDRLHRHLGAPRDSAGFIGIDISKDAVRLASKRHPDLCFVVADVNRALPVRSGAVALMLNVFAPRNPTEFLRLLPEGGTLIVVIPGQHHLQELRDVLGLIDIEADKAEKVKAKLSGGFQIVHSAKLNLAAKLDTKDLLSLALMTPSSWHITDEHTGRLSRLGGLDISFAFECLVFRRRGAH